MSENIRSVLENPDAGAPALLDVPPRDFTGATAATGIRAAR